MDRQTATERRQRRALIQRDRNMRAAIDKRPLPFPNIWDGADHSKVAAPATDEQLQASYDAFRTLCRPRSRRQHQL